MIQGKEEDDARHVKRRRLVKAREVLKPWSTQGKEEDYELKASIHSFITQNAEIDRRNEWVKRLWLETKLDHIHFNL